MRVVLWWVVIAAVAASPNYDAFSDREGHILADRPAAQAMVHDSEQIEAIYADAVKGNARAVKVFEELETIYFPYVGSVVAAKVSAPGCYLPAVRELSGKCVPDWSQLSYLRKDTAAGARLHRAVATAFEAEAHRLGLENAVILSIVNTILAGVVVEAVVQPKLLPPRAGPVGYISPSEVIGKTPAEIDARAKELGLKPMGPDPANGRGAYVDPQTGNERMLSHPEAKKPHAHVNDPAEQRLDANGNVVDKETPEAHHPIKVPKR